MLMEVPIVGSAAFVEEWAEAKMEYIKKVFDGLRGVVTAARGVVFAKGCGGCV